MKRRNILKGLSEVLGLVVLVMALLEAGVIEAGLIPVVQMEDSNSVTSVAFSPDGRYLASGGSDNTVKIWEVKTGKLMSTFKGHSSYVSSVAFSPDGRYLASGSDDNTIKIWEVKRCLYQRKLAPTSWALNDEAVRLAIAYGKKCKAKTGGPLKPWRVYTVSPKFYSGDSIVVSTPYHQIAVYSWDNARLYKPLDMKTIETYSKGKRLVIMTIIYGNKIDFAANIPAVIKVNGKVIHPIETIPQRLAHLSSSWPEYPAYRAENIYVFDTKHIPRNAEIWFVLIRPLGEEEFYVPLWTMK